MNPRETSEVTPAPSYPSPNAAQMGQGTMQYYNRQLTADELLSAELSREAAGGNLPDGANNGLSHGQHMVLGPSNAGAGEMGRASPADQQHGNAFPFSPNQQVPVDPNNELNYEDQRARRKRTKVSRACDECRRKKVRCDATSESGLDTCSNCRRLGVACQFSRVPMKRGPSKGYIKELAERLNTLESQMQPAMAQQHDMNYQSMTDVSTRPYHDISSSMDGNLAVRKRTFSMSEGLHGSTFAHPSIASRAQQPIGETAPSQESFPLFGAANVAGKTTQPFWTAEPVTTDGLQAASLPAAEDTLPAEIDEGALNTYYDIIHPLLPVLPNSRERLSEILSQCSRDLQEVFLHSLYAVTRTNVERVQGSFTKVAALDEAMDLTAAALREDRKLRTFPVNIVWLQTAFFMTFECDKRGPDNLVGKDGVPKSHLVDPMSRLAHGLAQDHRHLRIRNRREPRDADSNEGLVRRLWLVVGIVARLHTAAMAEKDLLGDEYSDLSAAHDLQLLGLPATQLHDYAGLLPLIMEVIYKDDDPDDVSQKRLYNALIMGNLDRTLRVHFSHTEQASHVPTGYLEALGPQMYWTVRLFQTRHLYVLSPYEVLHSAEAVVKEMTKDIPLRLDSPIDIFSLGLATLTFLEASSLPQYTSFCWDNLAKIEQLLDRREQTAASSGEFDSLFATPKWDRRLRQWIDARRAKRDASHAAHPVPAPHAQQPPFVGPNEQRSLQHLADLAVGVENQQAAASAAATTAVKPEPAGATATVGGSNPASPSTEQLESTAAETQTAGQPPQQAGASSSTSSSSSSSSPSSTPAAANNAAQQQQQQQQQTQSTSNRAVVDTIFVDFSAALRRGFLRVLCGTPR